MNPCPDDLRELTEGFCNEVLTREQLGRLEELLRSSLEARAFFRRYVALDASLREYADESPFPHVLRTGASSEPAPRTGQSRQTRIRLPGLPVLIGSTVAGCLVVATVLFLLFNRTELPAGVIGTLERIQGDVRVLAADGAVRSVDASSSLKPGDTVRTRGQESSTELVYRDGTRLALVGDTSITCGQPQSRSLVVHQGMLAAFVQHRPEERPLLLATPSAQVEVRGTEFLLSTSASRTELSVTRGLVRLTRIRDNKSVDVADGERAVVSDRPGLLVETNAALPDRWEAHFEDGLPSQWSSGRHVTAGLPSGSRGGVAPEFVEGSDGKPYEMIASEQMWLQGLFQVRANSHLHLTYRMERPDWVNIFIQTRTADPREPRFSSNYLFSELAADKVQSGRWRTVTIPLKRFGRLSPGRESLERLVPFRLMLSSIGPSRGLIVDRIWITPDGPGVVTYRDVD